VSEPEGRGAAWTEERGTSDEGRRRMKGEWGGGRGPGGEREAENERRGKAAHEGGMGRRAGPRRRAGKYSQTKALIPVMARPTMSVLISLVPS
jgi:hypothetical protein